MVSRDKILSLFVLAILVFSQIPLAYSAEEESLAQDVQTYASLQYDANGNLIKGFGKTYEYNSENQLVKIKDSNGQILEEYLYDHDGSRIRKTEYADGKLVVTYYPDENFVS